MTTLPPVSCYIRTLNEARMIGEVIRAAFAAVEEVVIVDSGSTDGTQQIAREAGARVIDQPWLGNGAQKRVGEQVCRNDWCLDLDADEIVSSELAQEIKELFAHRPVCDAYEITLLTQPAYGDLWKDFNKIRRVKLYNRRVIRMPDHRAWDQLSIPKEKAIGSLKAPIIHYPFRNIEHKINKLNRVSTARAYETPLRSRNSIIFRVWLAFPFYVFKHFVLRGLWRAGSYGFVMAMTAAMGRWLRDAKMLERSYDSSVAKKDGSESSAERNLSLGSNNLLNQQANEGK